MESSAVMEMESNNCDMCCKSRHVFHQLIGRVIFNVSCK